MGDLRDEEARSALRGIDCPRIAMVRDGSGFPRRSEFLPGNVSEPTTLGALEAMWGDRRPTVEMDAGIASEAYTAWP